MAKSNLKLSLLFVLLILCSIQDTVGFKEAIPTKSLNKIYDYVTLPLYFIPNEGQVSEKVLFYAKTSRYTLWITQEGLIFDSTKRIKTEITKSLDKNPRDTNNSGIPAYLRNVTRMQFLRSNKNPEIVPLNHTEHRVNYFVGNDQSKWRTNIRTSRGVLFKELYRNIDLKIYGMEKQIEYDFIVKPGGQVGDIGFEYLNIKKSKIDKKGNLVIKTGSGELTHAKPVCYQVIEGKKVEIKAEFKKIKNNTYGFIVEEYNKNYDLIIDPLIVVYSTYLGGSFWNEGRGIHVDSKGVAYVIGSTNSDDFPTKNPLKGKEGGDCVVFITKLNPSGNALTYSTFLGGSNAEYAEGLAVDSGGAIYLTGYTYSDDFPTQNPFQGSSGGRSDVFVAKINASGNILIYSTYLGGSNYDFSKEIAVDSVGAAYVVGQTSSDDFPTQNAFQARFGGGFFGDAFIAKLSASGDNLVYSTYFGGSEDDGGNGIAVDSAGEAYVVGGTKSDDFPTRNAFQARFGGGFFGDAFVAKVNAIGNGLVYSTYLGGSSNEYGNNIALDSEGMVCVTGGTNSSDFPIQNPFQANNAGVWDIFITKLNSSGSSIVYSTFLGGSETEIGNDLTVDSEGAVYVTGRTTSDDFPTLRAIQEKYGGGWEDVFIAKLNILRNKLIYSTYLGGSKHESGIGIAVDSDWVAYVTGYTYSENFPTHNPIQGSIAGNEGDVFITKLRLPVYQLTVAASTGGTTSPSPGIYSYEEGTEVTLKAVADSNYKFVTWSGDISDTNNPTTITMDSNISITANFAQKPEGGEGGDGGGGMCFITTACYGTPLAEEVKILCAFRDQYLLTNPIGRALVRIYYSQSPKIAEFLRDKEYLKAAVRDCLDPVIKIISKFFK